jgi:hypothetical protein
VSCRARAPFPPTICTISDASIPVCVTPPRSTSSAIGYTCIVQTSPPPTPSSHIHITDNSSRVPQVVEYGFDGVKFDSCSPFHNMTRWTSLLEEAGHPILAENCHNSDFQDPCQQVRL